MTITFISGALQLHSKGVLSNYVPINIIAIAVCISEDQKHCSDPVDILLFFLIDVIYLSHLDKPTEGTAGWRKYPAQALQ